MTQTQTQSKPQAGHGQGTRRWAIQMLAGSLIFGGVLFLSAGRLNWVPGWAYLGINTLSQVLSALVLTSRNPGLLPERSRIGKGTKGRDKPLSLAVALLSPLIIIITAGLDARFGWTQEYQPGVWVIGLALAFACQMFVLWAMASNPFFALTVRIQGERGHSVVYYGPYRLVRHPGYLGAVLFSLLCPLVLCSRWVVLPALLSCLLILIRTELEDRSLLDDLEGYDEYARKVRWRLLPGVW